MEPRGSPGEIMSQSSSCSLDELRLPAALRLATETAFTGLLELSQDDLSKTLCLIAGNVVHASSDDPDDQLGDWLMAAGALDGAAYDDIRRASQDGTHVETILEQRGILNSDNARDLLTRYMADVAASLFTWRSGQLSFVPGAKPRSAPIDLSRSGFILRGIEHISGWTHLSREVGGMDAGYRTAGLVDEVAGRLHLTPAEWSILAQLGSARSVRDICASSRLSDLARPAERF